MKILPLVLIIFWIILIVFPDIIAYLLGWFFVFIWINMLLLGWMFWKKENKEWYVKFGKYKIYR